MTENMGDATQEAFDAEIVGNELDLRKADLLNDINNRQPNSAEIWYGHSILTSTLFPASPPKPGVDFVAKSNGTLEYLLEAGVDSNRQRKFPYGKYPRLLMAWMAKQIRAAGKTKTATVDPSTHTITIPSIYKLCDEMGLSQGGRTSHDVQEQLRLLLACRISVRRSTGFAGRSIDDIVYLPLVKAVRNVNDKNDAGYSGAIFELTEEVYNRLARESAPFDTRASSYLLNGRSVLPYDVYVWLTGSMKELKHDLPISWEWLHERFGDTIGTLKNFKAGFRRAVEKVRQVYPSVNVDFDKNGIVLHPSPTAISARPSKAEKWLSED
ncbi:replication protein RepA [Bifidobacterium callitrichidarum]|uniref:Plasmid encoded RepA protein n=1 Tax=Bifidobacterium callitrichidarum TaxID=2052941 RepID=A0A2U2N9C3_9BIFI|nr:replication protein RepA [Bifidobacterium callitrichidarum]PWG65677.1 hypothetical protein DF196_07015 [Bifidobacterium callitrichidarum]